MDLRMPEMDGLEATFRIVEEADWPVRVLILTTFDPDECVYKALRAGASGFVLKDIPPETTCLGCVHTERLLSGDRHGGGASKGEARIPRLITS